MTPSLSLNFQDIWSLCTWAFSGIRHVCDNPNKDLGFSENKYDTFKINPPHSRFRQNQPKPNIKKTIPAKVRPFFNTYKWFKIMVNFLGHVSRDPKKILARKVLKNPKGGPFYVKKNFVSDSAHISCVKSLGHKDLKSWVSSKLETKIFFSKGGTLWCFSDFPSLNFLKNSKMGPNLSQKKICLWFWWNLKAKISRP